MNSRYKVFKSPYWPFCNPDNIDLKGVIFLEAPSADGRMILDIEQTSVEELKEYQRQKGLSFHEIDPMELKEKLEKQKTRVQRDVNKLNAYFQDD